MNWEELTAPEFEAAIPACGGVCLLPLGVIEKHGSHLPLGQDSLFAQHLCREAAAEEIAMVFPFYYFGQIAEARHVPGTIALRGELLLPLLENVCDEIARNGFRKVLIVNGHGGNNSMLHFFSLLLLEKRKNYSVFSTFLGHEPGDKEILTAKVDGHAGESETSCALSSFPNLVKAPDGTEDGLPRKLLTRYSELGLHTGIWWYADYPNHLAADRTPGTAEKGKALLELRKKRLIDQIRLLKSDNTPVELLREFQDREGRPSNNG